MKKLNKDELRNALIAGRLIDETGAVNATAVNYVSGLYTLPLLNEVCDSYQNDVDSMGELKTFLSELYEKGQYDILIGVLKIIFNFCSLPIPDEVQMIFNCEIQELKDCYLYEFLEDFQDIMYDLKVEYDLSLIPII